MQLREIVDTIKARQILTSRGSPTVEVDFTKDGHIFRSSVPSGASVGNEEAKTLLDGKKEYNGKSVTTAVDIINSINHKLLDEHIHSLEDFDSKMKSMEFNHSDKVISNITLPLSMCYVRATCKNQDLELFEFFQKYFESDKRMPVPHFNVLNGGVHSRNGFSCQEIMVCFNKKTFAENLEMATVFYMSLKSVISDKFGSIYTNVGDEGGFAPPIKSIDDGMELIRKAADGILLKNNEYRVAFDLAANSFFDGQKYTFDGERLTSLELMDIYLDVINRYPEVYSFEDPFAEEDTVGWQEFYKSAGDRVNIVADDLTVTDWSLISQKFSLGMFNSVLIKPNQIGLISETIKAIALCKELGLKTMVSHRSGETEDTFITGLALGAGCEYIKCGAPCRGERIAKYNELLRIEESLGQ